MSRMTAKDFDQGLLELYDFYAHGLMTKREFLDRAGKYAVGGLTAVTLLNMLSPDYALASQVSFTDPDIAPEYITYPSPNGHGDVRGYRPPSGWTARTDLTDFHPVTGRALPRAVWWIIETKE